MQGLGFDAYTKPVSVARPQGGSTKASTLSLRDFARLIAYAVSDGKKAALALQVGLTEMSLLDFFREAFGERQLSMAEKRQIFYEAYAKTISPGDWMDMDKQDILNLALPGDEEHLLYGAWNC